LEILNMPAIQKPKEKTTMGRRSKARPMAPTQRLERIREKFQQLFTLLEERGFGQFKGEKPPIRLLPGTEPDVDSKTGAHIGHVRLPLRDYLRRASIRENIKQRKPFDHLKDSIYLRLIRDFLDGALMPEVKLGILGSDGASAVDLDEPNGISSIIDGLQRTYCYLIALLLVLEGEQSVREGWAPESAWRYLEQHVKEIGQGREAVSRLLERPIRVEVYYKLELGHLLQYLVTYNTGQRRMDLATQLEIMREPLIRKLAKDTGLEIYQTIQEEDSKPVDQFAAADVLVATQAFLLQDPQVTDADEAERILSEDKSFLEVANVDDLNEVMAFLMCDLHKLMTAAYDPDRTKQHYLTGKKSSFFFGLAAACGVVRADKEQGMEKLREGFDRLKRLFQTTEDPMNLEEYQNVVGRIASSRGKNNRNLVMHKFLTFFNGSTTRLNWTLTAKSQRIPLGDG
jgi:hypothetical protein